MVAGWITGPAGILIQAASWAVFLWHLRPTSDLMTYDAGTDLDEYWAGFELLFHRFMAGQIAGLILVAVSVAAFLLARSIRHRQIRAADTDKDTPE